MYYNFARIHKTQRTTPAMAAGVTARLREIGDIVDVLEGWEKANGEVMPHGNLRSLKQQRDSYSCGQACVAMLTGASYDDVIKYMGEAFTDTSAIRKGLRRFGFKSEKRLTQFRGNEEHPNYESLKCHAILKMVTSETDKRQR